MRTWMIGVAVCIVAVAVGALVTGTDSGVGFTLVSLAVLPIVALIGFVPMLLGRRFARSTESVYAEGRRFTWWLVPAAGLGALELAAGVRLLIEDVKIENVIAAVVFSCFAAAVFAGIAVRARGRTLGTGLIAIGVLAATVTIWSVVPAILVLIVVVCALAEIGARSRVHASTAGSAQR